MEMENLWNVCRSAAAIGVFTLSTSAVFGQLLTKTDSISSIPAEISQILKPACMTCHSDAGRDKPKSAVNFSAWDKYNPTEKKMLAASIQSEVTKKSMPPKGFLNSHPDAVLTELQMNQIVQWCDSLKSKP